MTFNLQYIPIIPLANIVPFPLKIIKIEKGAAQDIPFFVPKEFASADKLFGKAMFLMPVAGAEELQEPISAFNDTVGVYIELDKVVSENENYISISVSEMSRAVALDCVMINGLPFTKIEIPDETPLGSGEETTAARTLFFEELSSMKDYLARRKFRDTDMVVLKSIRDIGAMADFAADRLILKFSYKKELLAELDHMQRMAKLFSFLKTEASFSKIEGEISAKVQESMEKNQREYYLRERMKAITNELGEGESNRSDAEKFREHILSLMLPEDTEKHLLGECDKLLKMPPHSHEATVSRSYLEFCLSLPWDAESPQVFDTHKTAKILDRDHYGMEDVKERIIDMVAVMKLAPEMKGQIICLAGPPGIGKTSIARSIAEALGRKYVRVSLGGVRDEADIRGHRKTYIGAMAGRIITALKTAGTKNPLILLDEVDKMGSDIKGDPASALLEVLDSEQNNAFTDHYVEVPFDLSKVLFITTANNYTQIPAPLLDRMDIFHMQSYTAEEKLVIARRHLLPKQMKLCGLSGNTLRIQDAALSAVISDYTREAGVRTLERRLAKIMRKSARKIVEEKTKRVVIKPEDLIEYLGVAKYKRSKTQKQQLPGVVKGLAWTSVGGEILEIEVALIKGSGNLVLTGSLGDVMKESARIAISVVKRYAEKHSIDTKILEENDIHIHAPEGAVPKDGPSAGITMTTAILSAVTGIPVRQDVAMTGEITLLGRVLPIGGLREKTMAAFTEGVTTIIIPIDNEPDIYDLSEAVRGAVTFVTAENIEEVLSNALTEMPRTSEMTAGDMLPVDMLNRSSGAGGASVEA
ncbi:MAG: endopeptidase La [Oscillospiraceae bacterium]|jgi:ATP-dependent Lon protease|nr:endopeptidase La [Oscillospiraceae bacterium]